MQEIRIYQARMEDIESIYNNIKACADDMAKRELVHWIPYYPKEKIREDILINKVYLVELNGTIVGNFILTLDQEIQKIYIGKLAVIPEYAGKGIGSKCLEFIENYAIENKFNKIQLDVYERSIGAINFYKKNGYKIIEDKKTRRFIVKTMRKELIIL